MALDPSLISDLPLFSGLDDAALRDILLGATSRHYPHGTPVFSQDEEAHSFFVLLHGRLRVTQVTPQGEEIVVRFVAPGDVFGITMALGRETYPGTAKAVVDSLALAWPAASWPHLTGRHPALAANAMLAIGSRLQEAHKRMRELSTEDAAQRIAHIVLRAADDGGRPSEHGIVIDFPLSRQDIAGMTGTTLHTVSRIMSAWEAAGIVESGRQRVTVRDRARLQAVAGE